MAELRPFGALRFTEQAGSLRELTCPPYDIISEAERARYLATNPHNIIRLELPREGADPYVEAGKMLHDWLENGVLACDKVPGLYIYEEVFKTPETGEYKSLKGVMGRVRLEEWDKGVILPHEETLSKAKMDRFHLMEATGCNFSSIYSLYFDEKQMIVPYIERLSTGTPQMEFSSEDGITHRVWKVEDQVAVKELCTLFADRTLYIADGHHRYETAINYRNTLREQGVVTDRDHPANFVMMMLVNIEHPGLVVLPTHRIVRDLPDFNAQALLEDCHKYFDVISSDRVSCHRQLSDCMKKGEKAFVFVHRDGVELLVLRDTAVMDGILPETSKAYRGLDVNILHCLVLERLFGIDKENMANQKNLIYTRDPDEAFAAVDDGNADCAFFINATRVDEIADVASASEKMPQKSTYFYPKLITGHVMNRILEIE